jgi:hypothetical protein
VIAPADLDLFTFCDTAEEAWDCVCRHYSQGENKLELEQVSRAGGRRGTA